MAKSAALQTTLKRVVALESSFFGVEFGVAISIGSVALFADSIDFLEDASINLLILIALGWSALARARLGSVLALVLLVPTFVTLWAAWSKFNAMVPPAAIPLTLTAFAALGANAIAALMLSRHRGTGGSMVRAAFLSARNDMIANVAIMIAGITTAFTLSAWPDLGVGICVALLNIGAAKEVWEEAHKERQAARGEALV